MRCRQLRRDLLGLDTPYRGRVRYPPGGQFWVKRDRILARPLEFYQRLYDTLTDERHPLLGRPSPRYVGRQLHVFFLEAYWHYVFGEPEFYAAPYSNFTQLPLSSEKVAQLRRQMNWSALEMRFPCDIPKQWERCASRTMRQRSRDHGHIPPSPD